MLNRLAMQTKLWSEPVPEEIPAIFPGHYTKRAFSCPSTLWRRSWTSGGSLGLGAIKAVLEELERQTELKEARVEFLHVIIEEDEEGVCWDATEKLEGGSISS